MLALETPASSAVGVAISITTIPAAAHLVAASLGEAAKALGALAVLGVMARAGSTALKQQDSHDDAQDCHDSTHGPRQSPHSATRPSAAAGPHEPGS
jgi:hypothetical protein